ncbi:Hypothetical predicted protein [Cloeon dipterum]|uniref:Uncharacterized protein n=1 Tax=Cloeon dipterum TaxID=197152 RepID=A0A8S1DJ81_9INSE|nr:Hypothetical predicted protein [Cloeon dipterum]
MLGLLQLLLFLLIFGNSHCDLITIKKGKDVVACLTKNYKSAVAFVKRPDGDKDFTKVDYSDGEGNPIPLSKYDCELVTGNCTQWNWKKRNYQGWHLASEVGGAMTDYRWNGIMGKRRFKSLK